MIQAIIFGGIVLLIAAAVYRASKVDLHPDVKLSEEEVQEELDWHPHEEAH